jgi:SRSO17 transposase
LGLATGFYAFVGGYRVHFTASTRGVFVQAQQYLCGLIQAEDKNMERMAEVIPDSDDQVLQHFLTYSPWSYRAVMDQVALDTDLLFGNDAERCLIIDESGIPKKGDKSVGVGRQWCGEVGKVENCQVGIFAALACGDAVTLIDTRLYLPESWTDNPRRCELAGVPEEHIVQKSKCDLAFEIVKHARGNGIGYSWVGIDGSYGKDPAFLRNLVADGEIFVADVHKNQRIYLEDPNPIIREARSNRDKKPARLVAQSESIRVDRWAAKQPGSAWKLMAIREGTQGKIWVEILHKRVWLWDGKEEAAHYWHLIVRRETGARKEIKYSLSNAPETTRTQRLAFMQGQRYWVERSLQNGKSELGLGDYQARKWNSWHHHMALVMMAMLFMLKTRLSNKNDYPLLSCYDVKAMLAHFLPKRNITFEEIQRQMEVRHMKRQSSIESASRKKERYITSRGS